MGKKVDVVNSYKMLLFGKKKKAPSLVFHWLSSESYSDIKKVLNGIRVQVFEKYIFGRPLPKTFEEFGKDKNLIYGFDLPDLFKWMTISFEYYKEKLNLFIQLKMEYEKHLLLGEYQEAEQIIEKIEGNICVSFWSIENRLLIAEYDQGLEKNKSVLTSINSKDNNYIVKLISDFFSRRTEKNISVQKYHDTLNKYLTKTADNNVKVIEYFNFKLNFPNYPNYENYEIILFPELNFSIIDRYIAYIQVSKYIVSKETKSEEILSSIKSTTKLASSFIKDASLQRLNTFFSPHSKIQMDSKSILILKIFDEYTSGNYNNAFTLASSHIKNNPDSFELYEIYVKSLIRLNANYTSPVNERSIANEICVNMYNILMKGDKSQESFSSLKKIVTILGNTSFNNQLYSFLQENNDNFNDMNFKVFKELNSTIYNPRFSNNFDDHEVGLKYIKELKKAFNSNSSTLEFYSNFYNASISTHNTMVNSAFYSEQRINHYNAKLYKIHQKYDEAIILYETLITNDLSDVPGYLLEEIIFDLFNCYLSINLLDKALDLFILYYFKNELLINRLNLLMLIKLIESTNDKTYYRTIEVTVLYYYYYSKKNEIGKIYGAYANFMTINGMKKPSEIELFYKNYNIESVIYFLNNICVPEILDSSIYFNDVDEVENERVQICQLLSKINSSNTDPYLAEISAISKNATLRKRLREVDESKIHVDVPGIIKLAGSQIAESYSRYKEIAKFTGDEKFRVIDLLESIQSFIGEDVDFYFVETDSKGFYKTTKSQQFMAYKELFIEIRDHFISSNEYGLDSYLSIKIRHGTFLNHIRSVFKTENLITEKNKITNNYIENHYWLEKLIYFEESTKTQLSELLNQFSKAVDDIITTASSKWLQINTEDKNTEGLFNYIYSDNEIYKSMSRNKSINNTLEIIHSICGELWRRTDLNLTTVRNKLSTELKFMLLDELKKLESELKLLLEDNITGTDLLFRNITKCGTDLQNQIEKVKKWFNITENKTVIDYSIHELFDTCLLINNTIYPYNGIKVKPKINSYSSFKGATFTYFVDIISILFENVIKYAEDREVELEVNEDNEVLYMYFSNVISETVIKDYGSYCQKLEEIKENINNATNLEQIRKEGGSGFYKIVKILKYDLNVQNSDLVINHFKSENILHVTIKLDIERVLVKWEA